MGFIYFVLQTLTPLPSVRQVNWIPKINPHLDTCETVEVILRFAIKKLSPIFIASIIAPYLDGRPLLRTKGIGIFFSIVNVAMCELIIIGTFVVNTNSARREAVSLGNHLSLHICLWILSQRTILSFKGMLLSRHV